MNENISPEERALLNEETMVPTESRVFCGIELFPVTLTSQRYIERVITWYGAIGATMKENGLAYGYLLSLTLAELRRVARSLDEFEKGLDAWLATLPNPIPADQLMVLDKIAESDVARIKAAQVEIRSKPGDPPSEVDAPPNS